MDAVTSTPVPTNEPIRGYAPGSPERASLARAVTEVSAATIELPMTIGGTKRMGGGAERRVVAPHAHRRVLGVMNDCTRADVEDAIASALATAPSWRELAFDDRAAIFLRAADLLAGPFRDLLNASTVVGQSKSVFQAEIDAACELVDFLRFNVAFARRRLAEQPISAPGTWNRLDYRPLEGFVLAITPFNFTSIAGNLPSAPALLGNVVVWKPASTQQLAAHHLMRLFEAAGLPPGVLNLVTGSGTAVTEVAVTHPDLAGIHFTGSTGTFQHFVRTVGTHVSSYRTYPRLVGETGGKDFVVVHPSADEDAVVTALARGAFEYQGQKCSAASRAYLPRSRFDAGLRDHLVEATRSIRYGDVGDLSTFGGAVIDRPAFARLSTVFDRARHDPHLALLAGGRGDDTEGYFVDPTLYVAEDPHHELMTTELFGPVLTLYVYDDARPEAFSDVLTLVDGTSPYGLTGSVFARDRVAIAEAERRLRFAAGNFYVNDKPTGAVVGQQPFGGSRASGTNDKAGSELNLLRWTSPRAIKETFVPPTRIGYPHMGE